MQCVRNTTPYDFKYASWGCALYVFIMKVLIYSNRLKDKYQINRSLGHLDSVLSPQSIKFPHIEAKDEQHIATTVDLWAPSPSQQLGLGECCKFPSSVLGRATNHNRPKVLRYFWHSGWPLLTLQGS